MKKGNFEFSLICFHCHKKVLFEGTDDIVDIFFSKDIPERDCPYCHQKLISADNKDYLNIRKKMPDTFGKWVASFLKVARKKDWIKKFYDSLKTGRKGKDKGEALLREIVNYLRNI